VLLEDLGAVVALEALLLMRFHVGFQMARTRKFKITHMTAVFFFQLRMLLHGLIRRYIKRRELVFELVETQRFFVLKRPQTIIL